MEVALVLGGLATIGKYLSKDEKPPVSQVATYPQSQPIPTWDAPQEMNPAMPVFKDKQASIPNFTEQEHLMSGTYSDSDPMFGITKAGGKEAVPNLGDIAKNSQFPLGMPDYRLSSRYPSQLSTKMNNVGPVEKEYVGPGLDVGANVPAYGGYQQVYRQLPTNVGGYKLTTLPGRSGPGATLPGKGGLAQQGAVYKNTPKTDFNLENKRPAVKGRAAYETAPAQHGQYTFTEIPTARSEQACRLYDGLSFGGGNRKVSALPQIGVPAKNKGDLNLAINNKNGLFPVPYGGYEIAPTNIRPSMKGMANTHIANPNRMNVIQNSQIGYVQMPTQNVNNPHCTGGVGNQQLAQNYIGPGVVSQQTCKGFANPHTENLKLAQNQLAQNPLAHTLAGA
jgi:hypothetical protein